MLRAVCKYVRIRFHFCLLLLTYTSLYGQQKKLQKGSYKIYQVVLDEIYSRSVERGKPIKVFYTSRVMRDGLLRNYDYRQVAEDKRESRQNKLYQDSVWKRFLVNIDTSKFPPTEKFDISFLSSKRKFKTAYFANSKANGSENVLLWFSPPIFSIDGTKAFCTVQFSALSSNSGSGGIYFFEKRERKWKLVYEITLYIV